MTEAPAAPAATEAPVTEPVNLTLSFWGSDLDTQVYQERVNMFMEKNPDIKVELLYIPSDYSQKVQTMIAGGTAPDVIQLSEDVHSYSSKGQVISLNDFVSKDGLDLKVRYGETGGLTTAYSLDGNLYAMPDRGGGLAGSDARSNPGVRPGAPREVWLPGARPPVAGGCAV